MEIMNKDELKREIEFTNKKLDYLLDKIEFAFNVLKNLDDTDSIYDLCSAFDETLQDCVIDCRRNLIKCIDYLNEEVK